MNEAKIVINNGHYEAAKSGDFARVFSVLWICEIGVVSAHEIDEAGEHFLARDFMTQIAITERSQKVHP